MHRSSKIPKSIRPPRGNLPYAGYPDKHPYDTGYGQPGHIADSKIAVVLATMAKMTCKWPIWLQIKMTRATVSGLSQGLAYGCALGTVVGVEEGYSHTVADMTCTQVCCASMYDLYPLYKRQVWEYDKDQGQLECLNICWLCHAAKKLHGHIATVVVLHSCLQF